MSAAKKIQNKIFSQATAGAEPNAQSATDQGLTIDIPKPPTAPVALAPLPKTNKPKVEEAYEPEEEEDARSYRQKVLDLLGTAYTSVEHYRLEQDARKERHWKRWGPYLAERQWVSKSNRLLFYANLLQSRLLCVKITPRMGMPGLRFPTLLLARVHTVGARTELEESATTTNACASRLVSGTAKTPFSKNVCLVSPVTKATMAKTAKSYTTTSIRLQPIRT